MILLPLFSFPISLPFSHPFILTLLFFFPFHFNLLLFFPCVPPLFLTMFSLSILSTPFCHFPCHLLFFLLPVFHFLSPNLCLLFPHPLSSLFLTPYLLFHLSSPLPSLSPLLPACLSNSISSPTCLFFFRILHTLCPLTPFIISHSTFLF